MKNRLEKKLILFLDCDDLKKYFKPTNINYHFYSFKKIDLIIFFKSFLKSIITITNIRKNYFKEIIKKFNPEIIVGNDINLRAVQAKKIFPEKISITYQFSLLRNDDRFKKIKKKNKKLKTDYFFCFSNIDLKFIKKYFKANYIICGSLRNNFASINKIKKKKNLLNYISEMTENNRFEEHEKKILKILNRYCKKNNIKIHITLRSNRNDKKMDRQFEINYFKKILGGDFIYSKHDSYNIAERSLVNISKSSNLGFELVARGEKVLFLPAKQDFLERRNPYFKKSNSEILDTSYDYSKIEKKIKLIINSNKKKYFSLAKKTLNTYKFDKKIFFYVIQKYLGKK